MGRWEIVDRKGFSPAFVMVCGLTGLAAFSLSRYLWWTGQFANGDLPAVIGHSFCIAAYLIGWISCWRAAASYPLWSPIRMGWLALSANCLLSVFRHMVLNPLCLPLAGSTDSVYLWSQLFQLPAVICLLFGILAMWWGVYRLGLGFRIRWFDCLGVAVAAAAIVWMFRNHLSHAQSGHEVVSILQQVSLGLLLATGGVGLLLHSLAMQMGGGKLAVVMRCVAIYALTRSLLTLAQGNRESYSFGWWFFFFAVPWIFAFGAAYFCWLAHTVRRSIAAQPYSDWDFDVNSKECI